jgi:hypothetical protein
MGLDLSPKKNVPDWYRELGGNADPQLYQSLARFLEEGGIKEWFSKPCRQFGDKTPADLVRAGNLDGLREMVYRLESGVPG